MGFAAIAFLIVFLDLQCSSRSKEFHIHGTKYIFYDAEDSNGLSLIKKELNRDNYGLTKMNFTAGDIVLDIGGNVGGFAIPLIKKYPFLKIYSYEPVKETYENFLRNLKANNVSESGITVFQKALTKDGRNVTMDLENHTSLGASLSGFHSPINRQLIPQSDIVESVTLKGIFEEFNIHKCKLLKMDCEGCEYEVLYNELNEVLEKVEIFRGEFHNRYSDPNASKKLFKDIRGKFKDFKVDLQNPKDLSLNAELRGQERKKRQALKKTKLQNSSEVLNITKMCVPNSSCIPRIIWEIWDCDVIPEDVQEMIDISRLSLCNFTFCFLTLTNVSRFLDISSFPSNYDNFKINRKVDVIKIRIIEKYGGMYSDCSVYINSGVVMEKLFAEVVECQVQIVSVQEGIKGVGRVFSVQLFGAVQNSSVIKLIRDEHDVSLIDPKRYLKNTCSKYKWRCTEYDLLAFVIKKVTLNDPSYNSSVSLLPFASCDFMQRKCKWNKECIQQYRDKSVRREYPFMKILSEYRLNASKTDKSGYAYLTRKRGK